MQWSFMILALLCVSNINAQNPVKKVYAFSRDFIPGTVKVKMKPGGKVVKEKAVIKTAWYFFMEGNFDTAKLSTNSVWIKKKKYVASKFSAVNTPVEVFGSENNLKEKVELVPLTSQNVIQVWPGLLSSQQNKNKTVSRLTALNELVIEFVCGGKLFYTSVKKIKVLARLEEL